MTWKCKNINIYNNLELKNAFGRMLKDVNFKNGWGGRIRTSECLDQNQVPYHLATPHHELRLLLYPLKLYCQY